MTQLSSLLADVAEQARVYDVVQRAQTRSRRRRRTRRGVAAGTALIAVLATVTISRYADRPRQFVPAPVVAATPTAAPAPSGPAMPTNCTVQRLPIPDGYPQDAIVTGGDPTGRFLVGQTRPGSRQSRPVVWDKGSVTMLDMPVTSAVLSDVNSSGVAVGWGLITDEKAAAYVYDGSHRTRLKGDSVLATAINESGVIVGRAGKFDGSSLWQPVVWHSPSAAPETLPLPDGLTYGWAVGIDDDGTIVGTGYRADGYAERMLMWPPGGGVVDLTPLFGSMSLHNGSPAQASIGWGMQDGWVVVRLDAYGGIENHAWNIHSRARFPLGSAMSGVVNANGWAVASSPATDATLVSSAKTWTLPRLTGVQYEQFTATEAYSYSDDGRTIGGGIVSSSGDGARHFYIPVVWHCE